MARISIIIPVYNSEKYLDDCLDSACNQTFSNIEIVCVNDGSPDSSRSILANRAAADTRILVVDQANGGPSSARNTGITHATGDVIVFLDADDALEPHACARVAETIGGSADAVVFGWSSFGGHVNHWMAEQGEVPNASFSSFKPEIAFELPTQPFLRLAVRREALEKSNVRFDESLRIGEDAAFLISLYPHLKGMRLISDKLYRYRLPHNGSIMHSAAGDEPGECLNCLNTCISIFESWTRNGFLDRFGTDLVAWSVKYALYTMLRQDSPVRELLAGTLGDLWRAHWPEPELQTMEQPAHVKLLMAHALNPATPHVARDLALYRIREYGLAHLATTVFESIAGTR